MVGLKRNLHATSYASGDLYAQILIEISDLVVANAKKYASSDFSSSSFVENTWKTSNNFLLEDAIEAWAT
ncbi:MAG: hypothetical protein HUJ51_04115 [Eggerthellaceae bacterium]|nr:hypothetical protein [Eggerthellaceae bacterium]